MYVGMWDMSRLFDKGWTVWFLAFLGVSVATHALSAQYVSASWLNESTVMWHSSHTSTLFAQKSVLFTWSISVLLNRGFADILRKHAGLRYTKKASKLVHKHLLQIVRKLGMYKKQRNRGCQLSTLTHLNLLGVSIRKSLALWSPSILPAICGRMHARPFGKYTLQEHA